MTEEPQLKYEEVRLVDCHDLDKFVAMHLDAFDVEWRSLESTRWDGFHNGSFEQAEVWPGKEADFDDGENFGRWLLGGYYYDEDSYGFTGNEIPSIEAMLQWLCDQAHIAAGEYVVKLWW